MATVIVPLDLVVKKYTVGLRIVLFSYLSLFWKHFLALFAASPLENLQVQVELNMMISLTGKKIWRSKMNHAESTGHIHRLRHSHWPWQRLWRCPNEFHHLSFNTGLCGEMTSPAYSEMIRSRWTSDGTKIQWSLTQPRIPISSCIMFVGGLVKGASKAFRT